MRRFLCASALVALLAGLSAAPAWANHSWNRYHWARKSNPFTVKLGDNVGGKWDSMLRTASSASSSWLRRLRSRHWRSRGPTCSEIAVAIAGNVIPAGRQSITSR